MRVISVRENPEHKQIAIRYFQKTWKSIPPAVYQDCIDHAIETTNPLPQWYLLDHEEEIIGCGGLITNDFISRMDLYPWICALFIDERYRGHGYGSLIIKKGIEDALRGGFSHVYISTYHKGYYEKQGFKYLGQGYHPWDEESRIYELLIAKKRS